MASQALYRRWRPQTLADVVGQEQTTRTLLNALSGGGISHAYLFCGPRGTGKTSTGRILAKAINCTTNNGKGEPCNTCPTCLAITEGRALDVIEVDAASNRGIDEMRALREKVCYAPNQARFKIYIIDEVHMLTKEASNALLKTLEEPPPHIIFILATTEAHKVLPTILSRCQHFDFRRISQADVVAKLTRICQTEKTNIGPEALRLIARATTGSLRDAENLLQQLTTYYGSEITLQQAQTILGITGDWRAKEMVKHIINNDVSAGVATINSVNNDGVDLRQFNRELVEYLRTLLLMKTGSAEAVDLTPEDMNEMKELAARASLPQILKALKLFGYLGLGLDNYSTLPLELALVDCTLTAVEERESPARPAAPVPPSKTDAAPSTAPPVAQSQARARPASAPRPLAKAETTPSNASPPAQPQTKTNPVSAPPAPQAVPLTPAETTSEIGRMKLQWRQLLKDAPDNFGRTPAAALLRSGKPKAIEDNTVIISFKFPMLKENIEKPENQHTAEKIISNFLGRACQMRCICEAEDDHLVKAALKTGAQIIDAEAK